MLSVTHLWQAEFNDLINSVSNQKHVQIIYNLWNRLVFLFESVFSVHIPYEKQGF